MSLTENEIHDLIKDCKFYNNSIKLQSYNSNLKNIPEGVFNDKVKRCRTILENKYFENPVYLYDYNNGVFDYKTNSSKKREHFSEPYNFIIICVFIIYIIYVVFQL